MRRGRPIEEGNGPLERFDEWCIKQYFRIRDGNKHEDAFPVEDIERDERSFTRPATDPELYELETR